MNTYIFSRPYNYIYTIQAKSETEARKKLDEMYIGDYTKMVLGEVKLISKTEKEKKSKDKTKVK